jgi:hypothetical protein
VTLEKQTRDAIGRTVRSLRELFEGEFGKQASGRFGIRSSPRADESDGAGLEAWLDPVESLSLTPAEFAQRNELIQALCYLTSEGNGPGESVARLIREAAFTAVNRLLAIRVAEAIGVLPAVLSAGRQSAGYRDTVGDLFPGLAHDEDNYWIYVQVAGDELAPAVPRLFDRRHPTSAFIPSRACVDEALELLIADELADAWHEPETLGWGYQFFNGDDVKQMRDASSAPRTSRELAVRNQFFTPRYVVDWLVQNTLGRRLVQAGYELDLPLLVGEVGDDKELALEDVRVLDPAVGSGHFLLGSYDLLERAWQSTGLPPEEAAAKILPCLLGIDIDPRAAQVAQAVLLLRARRSAPHAELTSPTIVTAVALPHTKKLREQVFGKLSPASQVAARDIAEALDQAPLLGSLLKVEQRLATELAGYEMAPRLTEGDASTVLGDLHVALDELVTDAASPEERMFTAEATDALRFLEICQQRYDAVLMNPPFGEPIPGTKDYLKAAYSKSAVDVYAAFVARGVELLRDGGHVGAITNRTGFFLKTFSTWRQKVLLPHIVAAVDLGLGVLHDALVETAAYVVARSPAPSQQIGFRSMLREPDKARLAEPMAGVAYLRPRDAFELLPNSTMSYWVSPSSVAAFADHDALGASADVRQGLVTGDDFRFVRLWWEVPVPQSEPGARWFPFAKGGEYAPYYADLHLVVDWEGGGQRIRAADRGRPQNTQFYFRPGLTWSRRTASGFALRALPAMSILADKGSFVGAEDNAEAMGWGNSRPTRYLIELQLAAGETTSSGGAARSYEVGIINTLPYPKGLPGFVGEVAGRLAVEHAAFGAQSETDRQFVSWQRNPCPWPNSATELLQASASVDAAVGAAYRFDDEARLAVDEDMGVAVTAYPKDVDVDAEYARELLTMPMSQLVSHALETLGGARHLAMKNYVVDRRLELICHLLRVHPAVVTTLQNRFSILPPGVAVQHSQRLVSYLVGAAFGRWNVKTFGVTPGDLDPWGEVPALPPGMLTDSGGGPALMAASDYPIVLPVEPLLLDAAGAPWDLASCVERVAEVLDVESELGEAIRTIGARDLRSYIQRNYFSDHLDAYSKSKRYAPIYWQLVVPSRRWGLWLYAPSLSRESLFAIVRAARAKFSRIHEQISMARQRPEGDRESRERAESLDDLSAEVERFAAVADEVAQSGWEPDLNDGFVLNAAPLEELFVDKRWRGQIARHREAMQEGDYPWATVQREFFEKQP